MTTDTIEEADALLKALPLGVIGVLTFELISIGPLRPIATLIETVASASA